MGVDLFGDGGEDGADGVAGDIGGCVDEGGADEPEGFGEEVRGESCVGGLGFFVYHQDTKTLRSEKGLQCAFEWFVRKIFEWIFKSDHKKRVEQMEIFS